MEKYEEYTQNTLPKTAYQVAKKLYDKPEVDEYQGTPDLKMELYAILSKGAQSEKLDYKEFKNFIEKYEKLTNKVKEEQQKKIELKKKEEEKEKTDLINELLNLKKQHDDHDTKWDKTLKQANGLNAYIKEYNKYNNDYANLKKDSKQGFQDIGWIGKDNKDNCKRN